MTRISFPHYPLKRATTTSAKYWQNMYKIKELLWSTLFKAKSDYKNWNKNKRGSDMVLTPVPCCLASGMSLDCERVPYCSRCHQVTKLKTCSSWECWCHQGGFSNSKDYCTASPISYQPNLFFGCLKVTAGLSDYSIVLVFLHSHDSWDTCLNCPTSRN
jgi:hypothetical protein